MTIKQEPCEHEHPDHDLYCKYADDLIAKFETLMVKGSKNKTLKNPISQLAIAMVVEVTSHALCRIVDRGNKANDSEAVKQMCTEFSKMLYQNVAQNVQGYEARGAGEIH